MVDQDGEGVVGYIVVYFDYYLFFGKFFDQCFNVGFVLVIVFDGNVRIDYCLF